MPHCNDGDLNNSVKIQQKIIFLINISRIHEWALAIFKNALCFLIPLTAILIILCPDTHNFLKEATKKIRKEVHKKISCGPSIRA